MKKINKKEYLELLIKSFNLIPRGVEPYGTLGAGGQHEVKTGWKGEGIHKDGDIVISFDEPDGFNMAVYEILKQAQIYNLSVIYISNNP